MSDIQQSVIDVNNSIEASESILEQAILATKQTERCQAEDLLRALTANTLNGTIIWNKSLVATINTAINKLDQAISNQLAKIIHTEDFKKIEGTWRGLQYLVSNSETGASLKIKMLNVKKRELFKDLDKAVEFDQSQMFKKIYENEFGMPGGEPYGAMIGDYDFDNHPEDVEMLRKISEVSAAAFCPFISAASCKLMGFDTWAELANPRDLEKIFDSVEYAKWKSFRDSEDSRFITLTMPRVLARLPYGEATLPIEEFQFEETSIKEGKPTTQLAHHDYCWMNAAYVFGVRLTEAFAKYGWTTAIRGAEGGGKVQNLPLHVFFTDEGDIDSQCPSEIAITDRREAELSKLGFLPLCHYKNTNYSVFFGGQTVQKSLKYDIPEATANAAISARMPYILASARFAHYLKVMARDKIGAFMEASDCEKWLNRWVNNYVNANADSNQDLKAKYPLAEAKIEVKAIPGQPGSYHAVAWLRPWLQFEELTTSLRMVARIPKIG
ncbi:MAG: type VI secretion system contractile sheath large subunit [Legionellales bacterium]|nr:type VI secretion system contractile sheath large subunit [Legionellales bacterium]